MSRDFYIAEDKSMKGKFIVFCELEDDGDAREMHGLKLSSKALADTVVQALRDAYQMGYQDGGADAVRPEPSEDDEEPF